MSRIFSTDAFHLRAAGWAALVAALAASIACGTASSDGTQARLHSGTSTSGPGPTTGATGTLVATNAAAVEPSPLPTDAVDASRFPQDGAARRAAASAATVYVSLAGSDAAAGTAAAPLRTIRAALARAAATPGTRVIVSGGTYVEGDLANNVCLAIDGDGTVVETAPSEVALVTPSGGTVTTGLEVHASHVTWAGISFEGFPDAGISIGVHGQTASDIVIADATVTMPHGSDGIAIYHAGTVTAPAVAGLLLERVRVLGADQGVTVSSGFVSDVALVGCEIEGSTATASTDAFAVPWGDNILVNGVEIGGMGNNGIDLHATRCAVLGAHVHDVGANGIALYQGGDIVNALVHDCGQDTSVYLDVENPVATTTTCRVVSSVIAFHNRQQGGAPAYAMTVGYDDPAAPIALELTNTVFYGNPGAPVISQGTVATIRGCLFCGAANGNALEYASDASGNTQVIAATDPASALAQAGIASGNLDFAVDPLFTSPSAASIAEFRPTAASPLIDAGAVPALPPAIDLVGSTRVLGAAMDVGPLEAR